MQCGFVRRASGALPAGPACRTGARLTAHSSRRCTKKMEVKEFFQRPAGPKYISSVAASSRSSSSHWTTHIEMEMASAIFVAILRTYGDGDSEWQCELAIWCSDRLPHRQINREWRTDRGALSHGRANHILSQR